MKKVTIKLLEKRIKSLHAKIASLGDIRPGALNKQCRWKDGEAYGEYWHLTYTFKGKNCSEYIPKECLNRLRKETERYRRFRTLNDQLVDLSIELSKLKTQESKKAAKES